MAIPRLPFAINNATQTTRRTAVNVPPTPTRFALRDQAPNSSLGSTARTGTTSLSPPNPSVPIASTLVPPTPSALHHPGYSGDKSAFLAPFEAFYEALNGSKQLKGWLADQLQKSNALMQSLKQQQEKMDATVEDLVEKRTRAMREEIAALRQRIDSLEESARTGRGPPNVGYSIPMQNGVAASGSAESSSSYRFPAPDQRRSEFTRGGPSPEKPQDKEPQRSPPLVVESSRRISISGGRPDSTRLIAVEGGQFPGAHGSFGPPGSLGRGPPPSSSSKGTPPLRPQTVPERSTGARQTDQRTVGRLPYSATDGRSSSRTGDSRKNTTVADER